MRAESAGGPPVDNTIYERLGSRWYEADDDPIALLRAESRARNPWIIGELRRRFGEERALSVLDLGCGGGFLANALAAEPGFRVTGADLAEDALAVAAAHDPSGAVRYVRADAGALPFGGSSFDAVCAMDLLEHVADPAAVVREAARVLKPGGVFIFHTFSRTFASRWLVIRGVEWFVPNTPKDLHVWEAFILPEELKVFCEDAGLSSYEAHAFEPRVRLRDLISILFRRRVPRDFSFRFADSRIRTGYMGSAVRTAEAPERAKS